MYIYPFLGLREIIMTADKIKEVKDVYSAKSKSRSSEMSSRPFFVGLIGKLNKKKVVIRH